jgi:hypothetical protein
MDWFKILLVAFYLLAGSADKKRPGMGHIPGLAHIICTCAKKCVRFSGISAQTGEYRSRASESLTHIRNLPSWKMGFKEVEKG